MRAAATTSRSRRQARPSPRGGAGHRASAPRHRAPRSRPRRESARVHTGRDAGTSRRIRAPEPRSRRASRRRDRGSPAARRARRVPTTRTRDGRLSPARSRPGGAESAGSHCRRPCPRNPDRVEPSPRCHPVRGRHEQRRTTGNRSRRGMASRWLRLDQAWTGVHDPNGAMSTNASGSKISARSSIPSMTRGPGRLK